MHSKTAKLIISLSIQVGGQHSNTQIDLYDNTTVEQLYQDIERKCGYKITRLLLRGVELDYNANKNAKVVDLPDYESCFLNTRPYVSLDKTLQQTQHQIPNLAPAASQETKNLASSALSPVNKQALLQKAILGIASNIQDVMEDFKDMNPIVKNMLTFVMEFLNKLASYIGDDAKLKELESSVNARQ